MSEAVAHNGLPCTFCQNLTVDRDTLVCSHCHRWQDEGCASCGSQVVDSHGICLKCGHDHVPAMRSAIQLVAPPSMPGVSGLRRQDPDFFGPHLPE